MPEIAECYSIAERLPKNFNIEKIEVSSKIKDIVAKTTNIKELDSATILEPFAYGKSIWFPLLKNNKPGFFVSQLGMTGAWFLNSNHEDLRNTKHNHLTIKSKGQILIYNDPRRFGSMNIYWGEDYESLKSEIISNRKWGLDPLRVSLEEVYKAISESWIKSNKPIKSLMLNQNVIFGIGNYLASEILYKAKINPFKPSSSLKSPEFKALAKAIVDIMLKAKKAGGFSFAGGYILPDGTYGNYYEKALVYLKPLCKICGNKINKKPLDGRITYFCPVCQKK